MKKLSTFLVCASMAAAVSSCGGAADPQPSDESSSPGAAPGMLTDTFVKKRADGTIERRTYQVTREARKASFEKRTEQMRLRKEGILASEIAPEDCDNGQTLWTFTEQYLDGNRCCLLGEGNDFFSNLCGGSMPYMRSIGSGWSPGICGWSSQWCGDSFADGISYDTLGCSQIDWIQLDF